MRAITSRPNSPWGSAQRPSRSRMISHVIQRAGGSGTLTHDHPQLPETLQGHHLPSTVIGHPQAVSTLFTGLPKRCQRGGELGFGSRGSSRHGVAPAQKKANFTTSAYTSCQDEFAVQPKKSLLCGYTTSIL